MTPPASWGWRRSSTSGMAAFAAFSASCRERCGFAASPCSRLSARSSWSTPPSAARPAFRCCRRCFEGPQDLSITDEAGDRTRMIWEWSGGATALPYSMHWIRPLRPVQAALTLDGGRTLSARVASALSPLARALDAMIARRTGRFRPPAPPGSRETLDDATLLECLPRFASRCSIVPDYDARSVKWALERARRRIDHGPVAHAAGQRRHARHQPAGLFTMHDAAEPARCCSLCAGPRHRRQVLDHLLRDAWEQGVILLSGRLEPALAPELSENGCLLYRRGHWTLVHSKRSGHVVTRFSAATPFLRDWKVNGVCDSRDHRFPAVNAAISSRCERPRQ